MNAVPMTPVAATRAFLALRIENSIPCYTCRDNRCLFCARETTEKRTGRNVHAFACCAPKPTHTHTLYVYISVMGVRVSLSRAAVAETTAISVSFTIEKGGKNRIALHAARSFVRSFARSIAVARSRRPTPTRRHFT